MSAADLLNAYAGAVYARDVGELLALYDEQARVYDLWGEWVYEGREAWRAAVDGWFGSLGDERVRVTFSDVQVHEAATLAFLSAIVTYTGESAAGEPLRAMQNRLTWGLRREDEAWRILHEHTSAPADLQTAKVMLNR